MSKSCLACSVVMIFGTPQTCNQHRPIHFVAAQSARRNTEQEKSRFATMNARSKSRSTLCAIQYPSGTDQQLASQRGSDANAHFSPGVCTALSLVIAIDLHTLASQIFPICGKQHFESKGGEAHPASTRPNLVSSAAAAHRDSHSAKVTIISSNRSFAEGRRRAAAWIASSSWSTHG
eukprot:6184192-Pleurochrysis_carterae.AAC.1